MATKKLQIIGNIGGGVDLDVTLTEAGKAADAKSVGDALAGKQPIGDYALATDVESLSEKVGDTKVSDQISEAIDGISAIPDSEIIALFST